MSGDIKDQYISHHWGQKVLTSSDWENPDPVVVSAPYFEGERDGHHLLLTPLSSITDEDAKGVARIAFGHKSRLRVKRYPKHIYYLDVIQDKNWSVNIFWLTCEIKSYIDIDGELTNASSPVNILQAYDFLRSKGYAIPFRNYSVDQLQEMGWLKLKTD